jgi:hypothetical protein
VPRRGIIVSLLGAQKYAYVSFLFSITILFWYSN